jgi:hypothetical protein
VRTHRIAIGVIAGGAALIVVVIVLAVRGGFTGDPYETVLEATEDALALPVAADVHVDLDLRRLGELARSGGTGTDLALGLLRGQLELDGRVLLTSETALVELRSAEGEVGALRFDDGQVPLVRLDPDALPRLPFVGVAQATAPGILGGEWVELRAAGPLAPDLAALEGQLADLRARVASTDADELRAETTVAHVGEDDDGWRFRVLPGVPAEVGEDQLDDVEVDDGDGELGDDRRAIDVWVDDDQLARVRVDAGPFLAAEVAGFALRGGEGAAVLDLRRTEATVPPRPEPADVFDLDALPFDLPFR